MTLIVDGYNLLHASGVFGPDRGARGFEQSRAALLEMLVDLLGDRASDTIVVFDAARAPDGLPARLGAATTLGAVGCMVRPARAFAGGME